VDAVWDDVPVASDAEADAGERSSAGDADAQIDLGESRWPPVAAILVFMALNMRALL
jgi:hypothetical protein